MNVVRIVIFLAVNLVSFGVHAAKSDGAAVRPSFDASIYYETIGRVLEQLPVVPAKAQAEISFPKVEAVFVDHTKRRLKQCDPYDVRVQTALGQLGVLVRQNYAPAVELLADLHGHGIAVERAPFLANILKTHAHVLRTQALMSMPCPMVMVRPRVMVRPMESATVDLRVQDIVRNRPSILDYALSRVEMVNERVAAVQGTDKIIAVDVARSKKQVKKVLEDCQLLAQPMADVLSRADVMIKQSGRSFACANQAREEAQEVSRQFHETVDSIDQRMQKIATLNAEIDQRVDSLQKQKDAILVPVIVPDNPDLPEYAQYLAAMGSADLINACVQAVKEKNSLVVSKMWHEACSRKIQNALEKRLKRDGTVSIFDMMYVDDTLIGLQSSVASRDASAIEYGVRALIGAFVKSPAAHQGRLDLAQLLLTGQSTALGLLRPNPDLDMAETILKPGLNNGDNPEYIGRVAHMLADVAGKRYKLAQDAQDHKAQKQYEKEMDEYLEMAVRHGNTDAQKLQLIRQSPSMVDTAVDLFGKRRYKEALEVAQSITAMWEDGTTEGQCKISTEIKQQIMRLVDLCKMHLNMERAAQGSKEIAQEAFGCLGRGQHGKALNLYTQYVEKNPTHDSPALKEHICTCQKEMRSAFKMLGLYAQKAVVDTSKKDVLIERMKPLVVSLGFADTVETSEAACGQAIERARREKELHERLAVEGQSAIEKQDLYLQLIYLHIEIGDFYGAYEYYAQRLKVVNMKMLELEILAGTQAECTRICAAGERVSQELTKLMEKMVPDDDVERCKQNLMKVLQRAGEASGVNVRTNEEGFVVINGQVIDAEALNNFSTLAYQESSEGGSAGVE